MKSIYCLIFLFLAFQCAGQVGINSSGSTPHSSAGLDVDFTNKGFLPPRLTSEQRDAITPPIAEGLTIYNYTTLCIETFIAGSWQPIGCGCPGPPLTPTSGAHTATATQIVWNWNAVSGATGYKYGTTSVYANATDAGLSTTYTQTGLNCGDPQQTLYVWAYNHCGQSTPVTLTATPPSNPSVASITGAAPFNAGSTLQLSNATPGGTWSSGNESLATVNGSGLVTGVMQGNPVISYSVTANGCTSTVTQSLTINWVCGTPLPKTHVSGTVAPQSKSVSYQTVTTSLSGASKCWIAQNLGADVQASSATDVSSSAAGWWWQFNRKQGYSHNGVSSTPSWTITSISEGLSWSLSEDPCAIELGASWRLPTSTEYINVDANGGWNNYSNSFSSVLKIHVPGLINSSGTLYEAGVTGGYWTTTSSNNTEGKFLWIRSDGSSAGHDGGKAYGMSVRCVKD